MGDLQTSKTSVVFSIIAHARSGALARAKAMFAEAGLEQANDDPMVLSVKGRLLKDEALAAQGRTRKRLYKESARAYAHAAEINGASYPLINAATLSLLAGEREESRSLARRILAMSGNEAETPYWRAATRAEAELLLGEIEPAEKSLKGAIVCAPQAYEDHASTLRQFGLILDALDKDKHWLDAYRPPHSLHFAGHMGLAPQRASLEREIRKRIAEERVGFGYGALAAGADILIAEALLEAGAELHVILPAATNKFRAASVASCGMSWAKRFDAIIERASGVRSVGNESDPLSGLAIRFAAEVAMGSAVMQAGLLMTEAVQLLVLDRKTESARSATGAIAGAWRESGRRQHILVAPRLRGNNAAALKRADRFELLAAVLRIDLSLAGPEEASRRILPRMAKMRALREENLVPPRWTGEAIIAAFATPAAAAKAALGVAAQFGHAARLRIAGDYGIARLAEDPFAGSPFLVGAAADIPAQILLSTPDSAIHVTEDFAAALCAGPAAGRPRIEFIGELPGDKAPTRLFALASA